MPNPDLIYLASPYKHDNPLVRHHRYLSAVRATGRLLSNGHHVYSPIVHNHPIATQSQSSLPTTLDFWSSFDLNILGRSDALYILTIPGWENSTGVTAEIQFAHDNGIETSNLPPDEIDQCIYSRFDNQPAGLNPQVEELSKSLQSLSYICRLANDTWWRDPLTGEKIVRNKGELLALIHSEISECLEGERKSLQDDHLPHRPMAEVELADALIRIFDYAGEYGYDIGGAFVEKMIYNSQRADHKPENRAKGGKQF